MKKYKLIIFDLDGTLVDAYKAIEESFNYTMQKLGYIKQDSLTIRRAVGWGDKNLLQPFVKKTDVETALNIYRTHHKESLLRKSKLLPYVKFLLTYLKNKKMKLAVASNRPTRFTNILLKKLSIRKYIDYVLCADKLKTIKPNPEILLKVADKLKVSKKETLYAGDMTIDIQAAKRAKIDAIAVLTGSHTKKELKKERPMKIFSSVFYLKDFLEKR